MIRVRRKTVYENRYHPKMGSLSVQVTRIKKAFLGISYKTLHKYRETYSGEVKDCRECIVSKV